jgi:adenine-specific DNA-methyltransferase
MTSTQMALPLTDASAPRTPSILDTFDPREQLVYYTGEALDFLQSLPAGVVKLVVTSPPYNIGKAYETRKSIDLYLAEQEKVIELLVDRLAEGGSVCWQVGNHVDRGEVFPLDIFFYDLFKRRGLKLRNRIIWHFGHGLHASRRFSGRYETVLWFTKGDNYPFDLDPVRVPAKYPGKRHYKGPKVGKPSGNPLGKNPSDMWELAVQEWDKELWDIPNVKSNHPEKSDHPCQFPIELVERCVLAMTEADDWVLDPYCGVGSALIAAARHGRRAMGCEREPEYVEVGKQRLRDFYAGRLKIRPMGQEVYKPTGREKVAQVPDEWRREHNGNGKV